MNSHRSHTTISMLDSRLFAGNIAFGNSSTSSECLAPDLYEKRFPDAALIQWPSRNTLFLAYDEPITDFDERSTHKQVQYNDKKLLPAVDEATGRQHKKNPSGEEYFLAAENSDGWDARSLAVYNDGSSIIVGESSNSSSESRSDLKSEHSQTRTPNLSIASTAWIPIEKDDSDSLGGVPFPPHDPLESTTYTNYDGSYSSHEKMGGRTEWLFDDSESVDYPMNAIEDSSTGAPLSREEYYSSISGYSQLVGIELRQGPPPYNGVSSNHEHDEDSFPEFTGHGRVTEMTQKRRTDSTLSMLSIGYGAVDFTSDIDSLIRERNFFGLSTKSSCLSRSREIVDYSSKEEMPSIGYYNPFTDVSSSVDASGWITRKRSPSNAPTMLSWSPQKRNPPLAHYDFDRHGWLDAQQFEEMFNFPLYALHHHMGFFFQATCQDSTQNYE